MTTMVIAIFGGLALAAVRMAGAYLCDKSILPLHYWLKVRPYVSSFAACSLVLFMMAGLMSVVLDKFSLTNVFREYFIFHFALIVAYVVYDRTIDRFRANAYEDLPATTGLEQAAEQIPAWISYVDQQKPKWKKPGA